MIRRGRVADADAVGRVFVAARDAMTYLPRIPDADRPRLGGWILRECEVLVAEECGQVVGFAGVRSGELSHLYVRPDAQGAGVGAQLLEHARRLSPTGLELWVFQRNAGARRFYERHGFRLVRTTDGRGNMEGEPDALYRWVPAP